MVRKAERDLVGILFTFLFIIMPFLTILTIRIGSNTISLIRDGMTLLIIALLSLKIMFYKRNKIGTSNLVLFSFILYGMLHVPISILSMSVSLNKFRLVYLYPIMVFLGLIYYRDKKINSTSFFRKLKKIFLIQGIIVVAFALLETLLGSTLINFLYLGHAENIHRNLLGQTGIRLVSLLNNPITLGLYSNLFIAFLLHDNVCSSEERVYPKIARYLLLGLTISVVALTFSLVAYIILFANIIFYLIFNSKKMLNPKIIIYVFIIIIIGGFVWNLLIVDNVDNLTRRLNHLTSDYAFENVRFSNWRKYLGTSLSDFFLLLWGTGLGTSNSDSRLQSLDIMRVENSYITFLGETGLVGLILFFLIIYQIIRSIWEVKKRNVAEYQFLVFSLNVFLIGGLTNDVYHNNPFSFYFWCIYGFLFLRKTPKWKRGYING